jgi:putative acetyltransferase
MRNEDALAFLEVHHAAVRGLAAKDYPQQVIEDWAPTLITDESIRRVLVNPR